MIDNVCDSLFTFLAPVSFSGNTVLWRVMLLSRLQAESFGRVAVLIPCVVSGQPQSPAVFRAQRGRVVFKCTDLTRNTVWHHDCNYDISKQVGGDLAKLVYTDRDSQNTLTLGVQKQKVPRVRSVCTLQSLRTSSWWRGEWGGKFTRYGR